MPRIIRVDPETDRRHNHCASAGSPPDATVWKHAVGHHLSEARAAYLRELRNIPTGLGRLAYLAILQHQLLEDHEELFSEFCSSPLQQKYDWLFRLLAGAIHDETVPDEWRDGSAYSSLAPRTAEPAARESYLNDIQATLLMLQEELGQPLQYKKHELRSKGMCAH